MAGESASANRSSASDQRSREVALTLANRVGPTEAALVLLVLVVGPIIAQLATAASAGLYVFAVIVALAMVAILILRLRDQSVPTPGLADEDETAVVAELIAARDRVAGRLRCPAGSCRANVFGWNRLRRLQINRSLTVNMDRVSEWDVSTVPGRGATGIAWASCQPKVIVRPFEGDEDLEPAHAARVDPHLQWIISVPICIDQAAIWVVNVDGREARARTEIETAVDDVLASVPVLRPYALKAQPR